MENRKNTLGEMEAILANLGGMLDEEILEKANKYYQAGNLEAALGLAAMVVLSNRDNLEEESCLDKYVEAKSYLDRYMSEAPDSSATKSYLLEHFSEYSGERH